MPSGAGSAVTAALESSVLASAVRITKVMVFMTFWMQRLAKAFHTHASAVSPQSSFNFFR